MVLSNLTRIKDEPTLLIAERKLNNKQSINNKKRTTNNNQRKIKKGQSLNKQSSQREIAYSLNSSDYISLKTLMHIITPN